jgi:hypothetical protein
MHIGIAVAVVLGLSVNDRVGFLGGGGIIEIDQGLTLNSFAENREVRAQSL